MSFQIVVITLTFLLVLPSSEGSLKKDTPAVTGKNITIAVQSSPSSPTSVNRNNSQIVHPSLNEISKDLIMQDQDLSSAESTPKVARHLLSEKNIKRLKMNMMKKPWFSSKIAEGPVIRILKKVQGKPDQIGQIGDVMRYAPRSLDTMGVGGLINYNHLERFYGNQPIAPISGNPNSLDHLFLPEFHAKDYMKPLEFNGIGNNNNNYPGQDISNNNNAYADSYGYGPNNQQNNFRGHPIDVNFPNEHDIGRITGQHDSIRPPIGEPQNLVRGEYPIHSTSIPPHGDKNSERNYPHQLQNGPHQEHEGPPPPLPPHDNSENPQRNSNLPQRGDHPLHPDDSDRHNGNRNDKPSDERIPRPDFSNEVEGDGGLWGIVDLAHMLQNSAGLQNDLLSINGNSADGPNQRNSNEFHGPGQEEGGRKPSNHFDETRPDGGRHGNIDHNYDGGQRDSHNRYENHGSGHPNNQFDKPEFGYKNSGGGGNHFDKPISDDNRGGRQYNRFDTPGGDHRRGNQNNHHYGNQGHENNRGQFNNNNQYDGSSGGGHGPKDSFRDDHHHNNNNYPDEFPSENHDGYSNRQTPHSPSRRPQYGGSEDEGSFYNSQEQFDGPRRPHHSNPDGDDSYYDGYEK